VVFHIFFSIKRCPRANQDSKFTRDWSMLAGTTVPVLFTTALEECFLFWSV
jgi:hypothetical protein